MDNKLTMETGELKNQLEKALGESSELKTKLDKSIKESSLFQGTALQDDKGQH